MNIHNLNVITKNTLGFDKIKNIFLKLRIVQFNDIYSFNDI